MYEPFDFGAFGGVTTLSCSFGGNGGNASDLGEVSPLPGFFGGVGTLTSMVTLLGFGGGDGGSAATEWVKRHSSPFLHRFFKKNLHSVLLTNWSGTRWYDAFRCSTR